MFWTFQETLGLMPPKLAFQKLAPSGFIFITVWLPLRRWKFQNYSWESALKSLLPAPHAHHKHLQSITVILKAWITEKPSFQVHPPFSPPFSAFSPAEPFCFCASFLIPIPTSCELLFEEVVCSLVPSSGPLPSYGVKYSQAFKKVILPSFTI